MDNTASPNVTVTADEGAVSAPSPVGTSKTVRFQCGLLRETEKFAEEDLEDVSLDAILEFVVEMLNVKVATCTALSKYTLALYTLKLLSSPRLLTCI